MTLTPVEQWMLELERERYAKWIRPKETETITVIEECSKPHENKRKRKERDKVFYDAGRFAAGQRDEEAVKANDRLRRSA